jgi:hypothetical protein
MARFNRPSSILALIAYAAVSVLAAAGPRVLCFAEDLDASFVEPPAATCCDEEQCRKNPGPPRERVPQFSNAWSHACELCVDLSIPGPFDQVVQRAATLDSAFHAAYAVPACSGCGLATAVEAPSAAAGLDPTLGDSPGLAGRTPILRC